MQVATGTYTGNGADDRAITGVGFQPDFVLVKGDSTAIPAQRMSSMVGDLSAVNATVLGPDLIQSLDADGFTVGTATNVNANTVTYYWTAVKAGSDCAVGTYTGNGLDNRAITGLGFQPAVVLMVADVTEHHAWRSDQHSGDASQLLFFAGVPVTNLVQSLDADGFTVGSGNIVNQSGIAIHYIAFKAVAGFFATGTYVGNASDNRSITGAGFLPTFVTLMHDSVHSARFRTTDMGANSGRWSNDANDADAIQAMEADGFQIGTSAQVNDSGVTFRWFAIKTGVSAAPATLTLQSATGVSTTSSFEMTNAAVLDPAVASCVCATSAVLAAAVELGIFGECFCSTSLTLVVPQANPTMGKPQRGVGRRG